MLECLPDSCVPDCSLRSPPTVAGDNPYYIADVQILANFAYSAQEVTRDIREYRGHFLISLIDFRAEDFIASLGTDGNLRAQHPFFVRIHKLIEEFDWQCDGAVRRIRQRNLEKSSAYIHHPISSNPPPVQIDAHVSVPNQKHPSHLHFGGRGGGTPTTVSKDRSVDLGEKRNSDGSFSAKEEPYRSAPSPGLKYPSMRRSETRPVDPTCLGKGGAERAAEAIRRTERRKRRDKDRKRDMESKSSRNFTAYTWDDSSNAKMPVPLKSSNLRNMKAPSDSSDSGGDSGSEVVEGYRPPPRPTPVQQKMGQLSPEARHPPMRRSETMPVDRMRPCIPVLKSSKLKNMKALSDSSDSSDVEMTKLDHPPPRPNLIQKETSRQTSEPPFTSFRGGPPSDKQSSRPSQLFGEAVPNDKVRKTFKYSRKISGDDEPLHSSTKDPPLHFQEAPVRSDVSSSTYEAASSLPSPSNSASEKIREAYFDFHSEYSVECTMFKQHPPANRYDRMKLYARLSETILQHVLLKLDAVEIDDEVLKNKKKQLIVDAQAALEQLDRVMNST